MEEKTRLWNKRVNDLTMGDQVKIMGVSIAVCTAVTVAYGVGVTLWERHVEKKYQKRLEAKNDKKK